VGVMSHEQGGEPGFLLEVEDGVAELAAERGVQVGEGFIEEEDIGLADEGFGESGALLFSAGELAGESIQEWCDFELGGEGFDAVEDFGAVESLDFDGQLEVAGDGEVGKEGGSLEEHADVAFFSGGLVDATVIEVEFTVREGFESGDGAEQGGFTGAGGSEDDEEFPRGDIEIELMDTGGGGSRGGGVVAGYVLECDTGHRGGGWGGEREAASGKRACGARELGERRFVGEGCVCRITGWGGVSGCRIRDRSRSCLLRVFLVPAQWCGGGFEGGCAPGFAP
jgi:hypothetical protein